MEITLDTQFEELEDRIAPGQAPFCIAVTAGTGAVLDCEDSDGHPPPEVHLNGNLVGRP